MVNFTLMPVLLCTFTWISSSLTQFYTVEVQPGEDVTLQCSNFSRFLSHIFWFKMNISSNASCISSMASFDSNASYCDGFQNGKFSMTSNTSDVFLKINQVDLSDSGLYFCGEKTSGKAAFSSGTFSFLKVQAEESDGLTHLMCVILGSLIVFLLPIIVSLAVKIRKFHTDHDDGQNLQQSENVDTDAMNYATVNFHPKDKLRRHKELEANVLYAATR